MTDAPKRIWAFHAGPMVGYHVGVSPGIGPNVGEYILATPAALSEAPEVQALIAEAVERATRVKPLVWFEVERGHNGYGKWTSEGYTVRKIEGMFLLNFAGESKSVWRFLTAEAAKAAAQADYEQRIRAAIGGNDE
jgi:hypothetical protein